MHLLTAQVFREDRLGSIRCAKDQLQWQGQHARALNSPGVSQAAGLLYPRTEAPETTATELRSRFVLPGFKAPTGHQASQEVIRAWVCDWTGPSRTRSARSTRCTVGSDFAASTRRVGMGTYIKYSRSFVRLPGWSLSVAWCASGCHRFKGLMFH